VTDGTLSLLFIALPDDAPSRDSPAEISKYRRVLHLLTKLCIQPTLFETLVIRLFAKLDILFSRASDAEDTEPIAAFRLATNAAMSAGLITAARSICATETSGRVRWSGPAGETTTGDRATAVAAVTAIPAFR